MNRSEADELDNLIRRQAALSPDVRPISNGEYVVVVDNIFLWSVDDWKKQKSQWSKFLYTLEATE